MKVAYSIIPNLVYIQFILYPNMATSNILYISQNYTTYIHICSIIQFQSIFLQNIVNYNTCTNVRRILLCFSVRSACTWKIVFKMENNELNELSECMLIKCFAFPGKHLKTVKLSFTNVFHWPCLLTLLCLL